MEKYLNKMVRYTVTGFCGVVTAYAVYARGETMLLVESNDTTGRPIEFWISSKQVEIIQ